LLPWVAPCRCRFASGRRIGVVCAPSRQRRAPDPRRPPAPSPPPIRPLSDPQSQDATRAVAWAAEHLFRAGDALHILHVVPLPSPPVTPSGALYYVPPPPASAADDLAAAATAFIESHFLADEKLAALPPGSVHFDIVRECASERCVGATIITAADGLDAAAVVLLAHSRSRVQEFVWGSVSKYVAAHTTRPVVLVH